MKIFALIVAIVICIWSCHDYIKAMKNYEKLHGELEANMINDIVSNSFSKDLSRIVIVFIILTCF